MKNTCKNCGSNKVITEMRIADLGHGNSSHDLSLEIYKNPDALLFKGTKRYSLKAHVCCACGKVETYLENPGDLWEIYQKNRSKT